MNAPDNKVLAKLAEPQMGKDKRPKVLTVQGRKLTAAILVFSLVVVVLITTFLGPVLLNGLIDRRSTSA